MVFYCTADGIGPLPSINWWERQAAVNAIPPDGVDADGNEIMTSRDSAQSALNAERVAVKSHIVAVGYGPRTHDLSPHMVEQMLATGEAVLVIGDTQDEHGGGLASIVRPDGVIIGVLRCPACLAPVRAKE